MNTLKPVAAPSGIRYGPVAGLLLAAMLVWGASAAAEVKRVGLAKEGVFAQINGTEISARDYDTAYASAVRQKFYHRAPPEEQLDAFRREVGDKLINRVLLVKEAERRGIKPDARKVAETLAAYDKRYGASPQWQKGREAMLPGLKRELEQQSVLEQLEKQVRTVAEPSEKQVRAYFEKHSELFTEPERVNLSVILLKVHPSSPKAAWDKALEEGAAIVKRLERGADFAELAKLHSGDITAPKGGEMGYVHRGMLPEEVHKVVDKLKPGAVSQPVRVLEGVAVLRLNDRKTAHLMVFDDVRQRAGDLLKRERSQANWDRFLAGLRDAADIKIDASRYPALSAAAATGQPKRAR